MQRRGLTLLELVVVLTILVALAGILVPTVAGLLSQTSTSAGAANTAEVEKWVTQYVSSGNGLDLLDNLGNSIGTLVPSNTGATPPDLTSYELQTNDVTSLNSFGIKNVYQLSQGTGAAESTNPPWNPTFFPYPQSENYANLPASTPLTTGMTVAQLNPIVVAQKFAISSTASANPYTYVVFGLGKYSTMSGVTGAKNQPRYLQETPLFFNSSFGCDPNSVYCRFGLIFQVDTTNATPATFVGAVAFTWTGVMTRDDNLISNANKQ